MKPDFRKKLRDGDRLNGTIVTLPSPEIGELLSMTGLDWLFIDAEHGPLSTLDCQRILQAVGGRCACIVRVPEASGKEVKKVLDIGATGVLVPQVNSAEMAKKVVGWSRYAPLGKRGVGTARANGYGVGLAEYVATANDAVCVVIQAEHIDAVENIESIVAVEGIDAVLIGPYDLSASMGKTGEVDDTRVVEAIDHVTAACLAADVRLGIFGVNAQAVRPWIDKGYTLLVAGTDALFLHGAAMSTVEELAPD